MCSCILYAYEEHISIGYETEGRERRERERDERKERKVASGRRCRPAAEAVLMERVLSLSLPLSLSLTIKAIKRREVWAPQELVFIDQHGVSKSIRRKLYV
jgi:hypothetical protein